LEYDESLRVKQESYYNGSGSLLDTVAYSYDSLGNRKVVSGGIAAGTYSYEQVNRLKQIVSASGTETYTYDGGGRVDVMTRDGQTLDLDYNTDDRISTVKNGSGSSVASYVYDSEGRRVKATDSTGVKRYLVAPSVPGGLESPQLVMDAAGNPVGAYVYAGNEPLMRLDAAGNPVYYLTDAIGSTIGLVDGNGQEVAEFQYDSFGNLRSGSGALPGNLGGDFRFQGQWLDGATGLYHMRARYYDPQTGRFVSRDPVDLLEMEPESGNLYQFAYGNPHVYSDPTGMITLSELNFAINTQDVLQGMKTWAVQEVKEEFAGTVRGYVADAVFKSLQSFLPFNPSGALNAVESYLPNVVQAGIEFEKRFKGFFCEILPEQFRPYVFFEPTIDIRGEKPTYYAIDPGYQCPNTKFTGFSPAGTSRPDFIFTPGHPINKDNKNTETPSLLIGDIKYSVTTIVNDYFGQDGNRPNNPEQWDAITGYAKQHGTRMTSFITLKVGGKNFSILRQQIQQEAFSKQVIVLLASVFDG
jgi:RHS repeat-associated protein